MHACCQRIFSNNENPSPAGNDQLVDSHAYQGDLHRHTVEKGSPGDPIISLGECVLRKCTKPKFSYAVFYLVVRRWIVFNTLVGYQL
jgi:hypothetical protein